MGGEPVCFNRADGGSPPPKIRVRVVLAIFPSEEKIRVWRYRVFGGVIGCLLLWRLWRVEDDVGFGGLLVG